MKKIICFCLLCFSFLFFAFSGCVKSLPIEFENCDVEIFCSTSIQKQLPYDNIKNGNGVVYFAKYSEQKKLLNQLNGVEGVTYVLAGDYSDFCKLQNKLDIKNIENTIDSCVGYSDCFNMSTMYKGKKVNVQMCYSQGKIYVGSPLILGCY